MKNTVLILSLICLCACKPDDAPSVGNVSIPIDSLPSDIVAPSVPVELPSTPSVEPEVPQVPVLTPTPIPIPIPVVVNPTPAPTPASTPTPTPTPIPEPQVVKSSSYNGIGCGLLDNGKIKCSDGTQTETSTVDQFVDVIVGQGGLVCGLQRNYQYTVRIQPNTCFASTDYCVDPPSYYDTYCWKGFGQTARKMNIQNQIANTITIQHWYSGPHHLYRQTTTNKVCVEQHYMEIKVGRSEWHAESPRQVCGTQIAPNGYLQ